MKQPISPTLEEVLSYAQRGWFVFPADLSDGQKKSHKSAEHSDGHKWGMTKDPEEIKRDFERWPEAVGIPTGAVNGIFVLEIDTKKGHGVDGAASLDALQARHGSLPETRRAISPSGSVHYYFKHPGEGIKVRNTAGELGEGIDTRGDGGMVIAPPSRREDGEYRWVNHMEPRPAPGWVLALICENTRKRSGQAEEVDGSGGSIDDTLLAALIETIPNPDEPQNWEDWNLIGMAIYAATGGGESGLELFHQWSRKSRRYNKAKTDEKWSKLRGCPPNEVSVGTLFFRADQADPGWRARYRASAARTAVVLPVSHVFGERPVEPAAALIRGLLPQTGVVPLVGQSGAGKTFVALNLSTYLTPIPDHDREFYIDRYRVKRRGGVLYLVLEGKAAFPVRMQTAFEDVVGRQMRLGDMPRRPFFWNTYSPNLFANGADNLIRLAERDAARMRQEFGVDLVAVFIDTEGLAALYENEDRSSQIIKVKAGLMQLSDATGALVIPLDHMGKDQERGARGSSAKIDVSESMLTCLVERDENGAPLNNTRRMVLRKLRDGEDEGRVIPYRLELVHWGTNEDGDPVNTCVVRWEPGRALPRVQKQRAEPKAKAPLEGAIDDAGGFPADMKAVRTAFIRRYGGKYHTAYTAFSRALKEAGLVVKDGKLLDPAEGIF